MNTKQFYTTILLAFIGWSTAFSQVGIGTTTPSPRSILELKATDKGLLLPRMTSAQRTAMSPVTVTDDGLQVYDTVTNSIWYWDNGWVEIGKKNIYDSNGTIGTGRTVGVTDNVNFDSNTFVIDGSGNNVGIGTASPDSKLEVAGAATNETSIDDTDASIDFATSNLALTNSTANSIALNNIKTGGAYTLVITGSASNTVTFTHSTITFKYMGTAARISGKHHIYSIIVVGTVGYVTMATEN